jgi:hypothetical protein
VSHCGGRRVAAKLPAGDRPESCDRRHKASGEPEGQKDEFIFPLLPCSPAPLPFIYRMTVDNDFRKHLYFSLDLNKDAARRVLSLSH